MAFVHLWHFFSLRMPRLQEKPFWEAIDTYFLEFNIFWVNVIVCCFSILFNRWKTFGARAGFVFFLSRVPWELLNKFLRILKTALTIKIKKELCTKSNVNLVSSYTSASSSAHGSRQEKTSHRTNFAIIINSKTF